LWTLSRSFVGRQLPIDWRWIAAIRLNRLLRRLIISLSVGPVRQRPAGDHFNFSFYAHS
jgi:hypothetical protein